MVLLLGVFVSDTLGIGPGCSPCDQYWYDYCSGTMRCIGCVADCSDCVSGCDTSDPGEPHCISKCDPWKCQYCEEGGTCEKCKGCKDWCAEQGKTCCNGSCYNPATQECCGGQVYTKDNCMKCENDAWVPKCTGGLSCCDGKCYDPTIQECCYDVGTGFVTLCNLNECCNDITCVPKCENTGQCDYGELPDDPNVDCKSIDPEDTTCEEYIEGQLCGHLITIWQNEAVCASCAPGCLRTRIRECVNIIPYHCKTTCFLLVCGCVCDPRLEDADDRGSHYECTN